MLPWEEHRNWVAYLLGVCPNYESLEEYEQERIASRHIFRNQNRHDVRLPFPAAQHRNRQAHHHECLDQLHRSRLVDLLQIPQFLR